MSNSQLDQFIDGREALPCVFWDEFLVPNELKNVPILFGQVRNVGDVNKTNIKLPGRLVHDSMLLCITAIRCCTSTGPSIMTLLLEDKPKSKAPLEIMMHEWLELDVPIPVLERTELFLSFSEEMSQWPVRICLRGVQVRTHG